MIKHTRITELATMPGVNTRAAFNFLGTLTGLTQAQAMANLELDARAYRWNTETCRAIQQGIMEARLDLHMN